MDNASGTLARVLTQILDKLPDRAFAAKLRKVYQAAAQAISRLSDMDLVKYETTQVDDAPDLSLWEEMAPVIRDTVVDVNALLSVIREQFPVNTPGGLQDILSRAVNEANRGAESRAQQAIHALQDAMLQIAAQITELGEAMRSPSVVSDRWNLLAEIQRYRTRFREEIGDLVYDSLSSLGEVHRKDVVPGYAEELASAVLVRATVADLGRVVESRLQKIDEAEPEDVQWHAQQFEKELDLFGRTPAYQALRAQDKRAVIEFRQKLGKLAIRPNPVKLEVVSIVAPFGQMVRSLANVNQRQILVNHDREVLAASGVRLEQAEQLLARDTPGAARVLAEAALSAQALYGREGSLDAFLRKARKTSIAALSGPELKAAIDQFRDLLAALPL